MPSFTVQFIVFYIAIQYLLQFKAFSSIPLMKPEKPRKP